MSTAHQLAPATRVAPPLKIAALDAPDRLGLMIAGTGPNVSTAAKPRKSKGRRSHGAKCPYCHKSHGDNSPWFNRSKDGWSLSFYNAAGQQRSRLIAKGWDSHDKAIRLWESGKVQAALAEPVAATNGRIAAELAEHQGEDTPVARVFDAYLGWLLARYNGNERHEIFWNARLQLQSLANFLGAETTIRMMRGGIGCQRVKAWADGQKWSNSTKVNVFTRVKGAFEFVTGSKEDYPEWVGYNPIKKLNTGSQKIKARVRRNAWINPKQMQTLLANINTPEFRLAVEVLLLTGCRPDEFCQVTAADVRTDGNGRLYWFVHHKNERKSGDKRRIKLVGRLQRRFEKFTRAAMEANPVGPMFRNAVGSPWQVRSLQQNWYRTIAKPACEAVGLNAAEKSESGRMLQIYPLYGLRHTAANRMLTGFYRRSKGGEKLFLNSSQVAVILGNSSAMVEKHYGHLADTL